MNRRVNPRESHRDPDPGALPDAPRASAFAAGFGRRLAVALGATAVLWLAVFWALAR